MSVQALGYVGVDATDLDAWRAFAGDVFAMQVVERGGDGLALRTDERCQRMLVQRGERDGPAFFGFETGGPEVFREAVGTLEKAGYSTTPASEKELTLRGVEEMAWCRDPAGNRIELFHGQANADGPFTPPRPHGGFRTGRLGMGHMVLLAQDMDAMSAFYGDLMGLRLSDYLIKPYRLMFMRANPRHHSVALLQSKENGVHHVMFETLALDDVGRSYDFAQEGGWRIGQTLGRHSNDWVLSFYAFCPAGFMMECGWGSRTIDDEAAWTPREVTHGGSMWGHDRVWLDEDLRRKANEIRRKTILSGLGAPLQVTKGQYKEVE